MAKVIAIVNQKGGVAKSTSCVNLGIGLVKKGYKVLAIDFDPQGSLTESLGYQNPDELEITVATILHCEMNGLELPESYGILHHEEGLDILPANIELSGVEVSLVNVMSREYVLKQFIKLISPEYDYILIDNMPSLGMLTVNALAAADSIIMKYEALKRQGRRTDLTLVQVEPKLKKRWAAEMVGTEVGETMSTIKRYIRLTYLSNYLLEFVDKNELPFTVAVDLSYLKSNEQSLLLAFIGTTKKMPNGSQAKKLKELSQQKELTGEDIEKILRGEAKVNYQKISFSEKQLQKYFPPDYKKEQIEKIIFQLLDSWKAQTEQRG